MNNVWNPQGLCMERLPQTWSVMYSAGILLKKMATNTGLHVRWEPKRLQYSVACIFQKHRPQISRSTTLLRMKDLNIYYVSRIWGRGIPNLWANPTMAAVGSCYIRSLGMSHPENFAKWVLWGIFPAFWGHPSWGQFLCSFSVYYKNSTNWVNSCPLNLII